MAAELTYHQREALRRLSTDHLTPQTYLAILDTEDYSLGMWRNSASCVRVCNDYPQDYSPNDWFPNTVGRSDDFVPKKVQAVCEQCSVRLPCLAYAIQTRDEEGIWGGRSQRSIRQISRRLFMALGSRKRA